MTIGQLLDLACQRLAASTSPRLDAEVLLGYALGVTRSFLYANPGLDVPERRRSGFLRLLRRREHGEPVAYLTGQREFWSMELRVTPDVLIPRPETELLVEAALERLPAFRARRVVDLGTGSGAIALAIARERPACEVHATDCCPAAVELARGNACRHGLEHIHFHLGHWLEPLIGRFDLIVSNPPYVPAADPHLETGDCRYEPRIALTPGIEGVEAIAAIAAAAHGRLEPGGWLLLEHGHDQARRVAELLARNRYREIVAIRDLAGHERVTIGRPAG